MDSDVTKPQNTLNETASNETLLPVGNRLAKHLTELDISVTEFAKQLGVSKFTASQWCKGKNITLDAVLLICKELQLSINWLLLGIGSKQKIANIELSPQEEEVINIGRHINNHFSQNTALFFQSINQYNAKSKLIETYTGAENIFSGTQTARIIALTDGSIVDTNEYFSELLGISETSPLKKNLTIFSLVAPEFQRRMKNDISTILTVGVSQYNFYQFIHQQNDTLIPVIVKSALIHFKSQLSFEMIIKKV